MLTKRPYINQFGPYTKKSSGITSSSDVTPILCWRLVSTRMAWGNEVSDGGGLFISRGDATSYYSRYMRPGTRFFLTGGVALSVEDGEETIIWIPYIYGFSKHDSRLKELGEALLQAKQIGNYQDIIQTQSGDWHQPNRKLPVHVLREKHLDMLGKRKALQCW